MYRAGREKSMATEICMDETWKRIKGKEIAEQRERDCIMKVEYTETKRLKTRKKKEEIKLKDNDQRDIKNKRRENMYQGKLTIYRGFRYYKKGEVRGQVQRQRR